MTENERIERVLAVFRDYIYSVKELDVGQNWKAGYLLWTDGGYSEPITTGEAMCELLLHQVEFDFYQEHDLETDNELPTELRPELIKWMQHYLDQLPEYAYLVEEILA